MLFESLSKYFFFFIVPLGIYPGQVNAQDLVYSGKQTLYSHTFSDIILEVSPNYIYREDAYPRITASINMQYFITHNVSANGNLAVGQDYLHFGPGIIGIPLLAIGNLITRQENEDIILFFLILAGSFENVSFHIPVTPNLSISPYFSLLRVQYLYNTPASEYNDFNVSFALGTRFNFYVSNNWLVSPYLEYTRTYVSGLNGLQGGVYTGYCFRSRISY